MPRRQRRWAYHATALANLASIAREGLRADPYLYFADDPFHAGFNYGGTPSKHDTVILRFPWPADAEPNEGYMQRLMDEGDSERAARRKHNPEWVSRTPVPSAQLSRYVEGTQYRTWTPLSGAARLDGVWWEDEDPKWPTRYSRSRHAGWVPTGIMERYIDVVRDGHQARPDSARNIPALVRSMQQFGFIAPIILDYHQDARTVRLAEGHHRLIAARRAGFRYVLVRVARRRYDPHKSNDLYRPAKPVPGIEPDEFGYVPGDMTPQQIGIPGARPLSAEERALDELPVREVAQNPALLRLAFPPLRFWYGPLP